MLINKILVLEGGYNEEHEVSINTSKEVQKSLINQQYNFEVMTVNPEKFSKEISKYDDDFICFNALHGPFGEDGSIQKILEEKKFKFTHSTSQASKIAFDKNLTKTKIKETNVPTPDSIIIEKKEIIEKIFFNAFNEFDSFVLKPVSSGSSFGVKIMQSIQDIESFFNNYNKEIQIYNKHNHLMIEKYINGRELTVTVFETENISKAIEVTEIIPKNIFFDYKAKYTSGFSKHVLPADIPVNIYNQCLNFAKIVHDSIGCRGLSRSDFLYSNDQVFFLEINTQPGLTPISLVPEQLKYYNISFDMAIKNIIDASI